MKYTISGQSEIRVGENNMTVCVVSSQIDEGLRNFNISINVLDADNLNAYADEAKVQINECIQAFKDKAVEVGWKVLK